MYLGYAAPGLPVTVRIGQMTEAGSIEDTTSSKYITFMERALPVLAFSPATRRLGIRADTHGEAWHAAAGFFGDSAGDDESTDEGFGGSTRLCVAPFRDAGRVLHFGISGQVRAPRDDAARFAVRPEAHVDDTRLVDTGPMTNVNATATAGLEAACVLGPFSLQSEYVGVAVERDDAESPWLDGYYVAASWFLTGESRPYDAATGEFVRLRPRRPAGADGIGAWEVALRHSAVNLDDAVRGGREENVSAAVNWYVNDHTRFAVNFVHASVTSDAGDVDADIVQARAQIDF
jgi:phosphate-selective porin OprO/OprP